MRTDTFALEVPLDVELFVHQWLPDAGVELRGIVQIALGLAEHSARYARFAQHLTGLGYAVYAHDHRGHGRTSPEAEHGTFAEHDGWDLVVGDMRRLRRRIRELHGDLPFVLFGHSMGSAIALNDLFKHPGEVEAAVFSGPPGKVGPIRHAGRVVAWIEGRRLGSRAPSNLLDGMAFGRYNAQFPNPRTEFDWLSSDPDEVDKYVADPWCGFKASPSLWGDLLGGQGRLQDPDNLARIPHDLPIYVFAGDRDPVGGNGTQVRALVEIMRQQGLDVTLELWPGGRHEMLNERNREDVMRDVSDWIERRLPRRVSERA